MENTSDKKKILVYPIPTEAAGIFCELIDAERSAAMLKQQLSACCLMHGYPNASSHFHDEAKKELDHAKRIIDYLISRGFEPEMGDVEMPKVDANTLSQVIEVNYMNELIVTKAYDEAARDLFKLDLMSFNLANEFIEIQQKELAENSRLYNSICGVDAPDQKQMDSFLFQSNIAIASE